MMTTKRRTTRKWDSKPIRCPTCYWGFATKRGYNQHVRLAHGPTKQKTANKAGKKRVGRKPAAIDWKAVWKKLDAWEHVHYLCTAHERRMKIKQLVEAQLKAK